MVECRITPIEYIENLRNTLSRAKAEGVSSGNTNRPGNTNRKPLARQKGQMARVMNAAGFHHPQWMKFIKNMEEDKIESIREEEDGEDKDNVVLDILKRMYTRQSARNKRLVCAVKATRGMYKGIPFQAGVGMIYL